MVDSADGDHHNRGSCNREPHSQGCKQGMRLGIVCAMHQEAAALGIKAIPMQLMELPGVGLMLLGGMGHERARAAAALLADARVDALLSWGMAGALAPDLVSGQILCPRRVLTDDGQSYPVDPVLHADCLDKVCPDALSGDLFCSEAPVLTVAAKQELYCHHAAIAVDMESAAIAAVALERGLPFVVLRCVLDSSQTALPSLCISAVDAYGQVQTWSLLRSLLSRPTESFLLPALARQSRLARQRLTSMAAYLPTLALRTGEPA
ncbi:MAG: purine and other phosphorylase-like protein, family 1 [Pseudomonadales bacterium]|nr:purine and other phosphorylase-like protein, family 1 [Pseudomonadales bacterium]